MSPYKLHVHAVAAVEALRFMKKVGHNYQNWTYLEKKNEVGRFAQRTRHTCAREEKEKQRDREIDDPESEINLNFKYHLRIIDTGYKQIKHDGQSYLTV